MKALKKVEEIRLLKGFIYMTQKQTEFTAADTFFCLSCKISQNCLCSLKKRIIRMQKGSSSSFIIGRLILFSALCHASNKDGNYVSPA